MRVVSPNHKCSIIESNLNNAAEVDKSLQIKQRINQAEQRKAVYATTKKGLDNDNFITHMQTLRKNSRSGNDTIDQTAHSMFNSTTIEARQSGVFAKPSKLPKTATLSRAYSYGPASPSSHNIQHESSSSIGSINEVYENYK